MICLFNYGLISNSVHPGFILTPMLEKMIRTEVENTGCSYEEAKKRREDWTPMRRLGDPEDVAYAVLYLASDESKYMTGSELVIDGGFTAQ